MTNILQPPFQVRTAGLITRQPYHSTPGTRQEDVMLTVFLTGSGTYQYSRGVQRVYGGMVGLVPPYDRGILMADPTDPYSHYYCRFRGDYARAMAAEILDRHGLRFFPFDRVPALADLLRPMVPYFAGALPGRMGWREALLAQALVLLQEEPCLEEGMNATTLTQYLRDHVHEPTDLRAIAAHFHLSTSTLCHRTRRMLSTTVQRLHEAMKIEHACTLLQLGTLSIAGVAQRTGYADPYYFSRVFRKHMGVSPRQWSRTHAGSPPA
jgi:AraC-like DNA-binding protein